MSKRLQDIFRKNAEWEKESPYNFCDRWCERCTCDEQIRCTLYKDELERKMTCIAHGREPDDPEMTAEIIEKQYEKLEKSLEETAEEFGIDLDEVEGPEWEKIKEHIKFVENNPLDATAAEYCKKARAFLEETFYKDGVAGPDLAYDFKTVSWYHTLLPAKLHRALCGFHEPACEGEISLYDAIAQFEVCKKAIKQSIESLRKIDKHLPSFNTQISKLLALLHNIYSRIEMMEESI